MRQHYPTYVSILLKQAALVPASYPLTLALHLTSQILFSEIRNDRWCKTFRCATWKKTTLLQIGVVKLGGGSVPLRPPPALQPLHDQLSHDARGSVACWRRGVAFWLGSCTGRIPRQAVKRSTVNPRATRLARGSCFMTPKSAHCAPLKGPRCELSGKEQLTVVKWSNSSWGAGGGESTVAYMHTKHCYWIGMRFLAVGCAESCEEAFAWWKISRTRVQKLGFCVMNMELLFLST